jgi:adenylate kinase
MRIVLLGAPGSGKGTQAAILTEHLGVPHISTGVLLRAAVEAGTELGAKARSIMDRGELLPDDIMLDLIAERLQAPDAEPGFVLDGYPRNLSQAASLDGLLDRLEKPLDIAIQIDVDAEQIIRRIAKRAAEEGRSDDSEETVRTRMQVYQEQTAAVVDHYAREGLLTQVFGEGSIEDVNQRIMAVLKADSID